MPEMHVRTTRIARQNTGKAIKTRAGGAVIPKGDKKGDTDTLRFVEHYKNKGFKNKT